MRLSELQSRKVGIWGYGREGRAAVAALNGSAQLFVASDRALPASDEEQLDALGVAYGTGGDAINLLADCEVVIRSPGVSVYRQEMKGLKDRGVAITTGTDIWFAENPGAISVGITGTKGKSTSASLLAHLLRDQGKQVELAGNIGRPLLELLNANSLAQIYVLELSAQQTADLQHSPSVAMITNLHREHLDWHLTEENYFSDKLNLIRHRDGMVAVLNGEDEQLRRRAPQGIDVRWYGTGGRFAVDQDQVTADGAAIYSAGQISLPGRHNLMNIAGVLTALDAVGGDPMRCAAGLAAFRPLEHRLETVATIEGVTYVNDSISTTPIAAWAAVKSYAGAPITLLLGGFERQQVYDQIINGILDDSNVTAVLTLPDNGERIFAQFEQALHGRPGVRLQLERTQDLESAVDRAGQITPTGGVVLMSPAAPSFGRFENFKQRGELFKKCVAELSTTAARPK